MSWTFERPAKMGGAMGEAYRNTLLATGMSTSGVLAREVIQNSVDARIENDAKVRVRFRHEELTRDRKRGFVDLLQLGVQFVARKDHLNLRPDHCLATLDTEDEPLHVLFVDDFETTGLTGDPYSTEDSHFHRLLLSLGDSSKSRSQETSGGSYGYGKSVYPANSRINTMVAYSVFRPGNDGVWARLMGCAYFDNHHFNGEHFTGRAWFGQSDGVNANESAPFENEDAQKLAEKLGFDVHTLDQTGTSVLIVDCAFHADELRTSIEDWWWPRLLSDALDVEIFENGRRVDPPRPQKREDLRAFVRCFRLANGTAVVAGKDEKVGSFNKRKDVPVGDWAIKLVDEEAPELQADGDRLNTLALIRAPRMVIEYFKAGNSSLPYQGVVVVTEREIDHALMRSEPAAHDKWDPRSTRFESDDQRAIVESILSRAKLVAQKFAREAMPQEPKGNVRLTFLERLLGAVLRPPTTPTGIPPKGKVDPITIKYLEGPTIQPDGDRLRTIGKFTVGLSDSAPKSETMVRVEVRCVPREDEGRSSSDRIGVRLEVDASAPYELSQDDASLVVLIDRNTASTITFVSSPYPRDWAIDADLLVGEEL